MKKIIIVSLLCVTFNSKSYSQTILGVGNEQSFSENLYSNEKRSLNKTTLDSMLKRQQKKSAPPPLLTDVSDTLRCKVYSFHGKKLIIKDCGEALWNGNKLLWKKGFIDCFSDSNDYSGDTWVYFIPLFSGDFKTLLYQEDRMGTIFLPRSGIVEINLDTGEKTLIKTKCINPKYSPDEKFILLQDRDKNHKFYIYDRSLKKVIRKYKNLQRMVWLE